MTQIVSDVNRLLVRPEKQTINVMLVDTHKLILAALLRVVAAFPLVRVVMHMQTINDVLTFIEKKSVDVVVFGVSVPISTCLQFTHSLAACKHDLGIIVIQPRLRHETTLTLVKYGVHGLLDDFASEQDLADAISAVANGNTFFSEHARGTILSSMSRTSRYLTAREIEVATLLMRGTSNFKIAQTLGLKEKTIEAYLTHIYGKLGVSSRAEAIICLQDLRV